MEKEGRGKGCSPSHVYTVITPKFDKTTQVFVSVPKMTRNIVIRSIFPIALGLSTSVIFCQKNFSKQHLRTQMSEQQFESQLPTLI